MLVVHPVRPVRVAVGAGKSVEGGRLKVARLAGGPLAGVAPRENGEERVVVEPGTPPGERAMTRLTGRGEARDRVVEPCLEIVRQVAARTVRVNGGEAAVRSVAVAAGAADQAVRACQGEGRAGVNELRAGEGKVGRVVAGGAVEPELPEVDIEMARGAAVPDQPGLREDEIEVAGAAGRHLVPAGEWKAGLRIVVESDVLAQWRPRLRGVAGLAGEGDRAVWVIEDAHPPGRRSCERVGRRTDGDVCSGSRIVPPSPHENEACQQQGECQGDGVNAFHLRPPWQEAHSSGIGAKRTKASPVGARSET